MEKEKEVLQVGNFIISKGNDGFPYYRVSTASPQVEWKFYQQTFIHMSIDVCLENKEDKQARDVLRILLIVAYYTATTGDPNMVKLTLKYLENKMEAVDVGEDIDITEAKAAYYVGKILDDMVDDDSKSKEGK